MNYNKNKVFLGIGIFLFILMTSFNVYMYFNKGNINNETVKQSEKELALYKKEIEMKEKEYNSISNNIKKEVRESEENKIVNSTKRFFEFIYDNDADNYVTRKKDASKYMGDGMIERFFPSDNAIENDQKVEVSNINVYIKHKTEDENEDEVRVIATYSLMLSIEENDYANEDIVYMNVILKEREGQFRVIELEEFNNEGNMIYE